MIFYVQYTLSNDSSRIKKIPKVTHLCCATATVVMKNDHWNVNSSEAQPRMQPRARMHACISMDRFFLL